MSSWFIFPKTQPTQLSVLCNKQKTISRSSDRHGGGLQGLPAHEADALRQISRGALLGHAGFAGAEFALCEDAQDVPDGLSLELRGYKMVGWCELLVFENLDFETLFEAFEPRKQTCGQWTRKGFWTIQTCVFCEYSWMFVAYSFWISSICCQRLQQKTMSS